MEIQQLRYVVAVAEELHFGRAAERLHVAQQSVSEQIRRLERELGGPLFARTSRRVSLTSAGAAFVPAAARALEAIDEAADTARRVIRGSAGGIRIGYPTDGLGQRLIQHAAPALGRLDPPLHVHPVPMTTPDQLTALAERRLDFAFGWTPDLAAELDSLLVARDPLVLAVSERDPLAALPAVPPEAISHRPIVLAPRAVNPLLYERTVGQLVAAGAVLSIHQEINSLDRMLPVVLAGTAIAVTAATSADAHPTPGIAYRPFTEPSPWIDHTLVWRAGDRRPAVAAFVEIVQELRDGGAFLPPDAAQAGESDSAGLTV
jgi:DNA-binding transcriptional LysR family regulator